jgi:hypothetical protein
LDTGSYFSGDWNSSAPATVKVTKCVKLYLHNPTRLYGVRYVDIGLKANVAKHFLSPLMHRIAM